MPALNIGERPSSVEAFVTLRDRLAQSPEGGAAVFATALLLYLENADLGRQCLTIAADRDRLQKSATGYKGFELSRPELRRIDERVGARPHVARSYVQGTRPEEGYRLPDGPLIFEISADPRGGDINTGRAKVFLASTGADLPRPVTLQRNNRGLWKAKEWSSLTLGVRPPVEALDDTL